MGNAPIIPDAILLDRVIGEIQVGLSSLPWLDAAFGRAQKLIKEISGRRIITPNVYCGGWNGHGGNDYIEVSPDSEIGNFSFFEIRDPQEVSSGSWVQDYRTPFSLIFWLDLRKVYGEATNRNVEDLKKQVLKLLSGRTGWYLSQGSIRVSKIYEQAENIYRGYSLSEVDNQFLMHPFAGFRIEGELRYSEECIPTETWYLKTKDNLYYTFPGGGRYIVKH